MGRCLEALTLEVGIEMPPNVRLVVRGHCP